MYETAAVYYLEQPDFLNCVVEADTELFPMRLLLRVSNIERSMGRKRSIPKGPRNIDIDILLYMESSVVDTAATADSASSHGGAPIRVGTARGVAPDLRHPVDQRTIRQMLASAPQQRVLKLAAPLSVALD